MYLIPREAHLLLRGHYSILTLQFLHKGEKCSDFIFLQPLYQVILLQPQLETSDKCTTEAFNRVCHPVQLKPMDRSRVREFLHSTQGLRSKYMLGYIIIAS